MNILAESLFEQMLQIWYDGKETITGKREAEDLYSSGLSLAF